MAGCEKCASELAGLVRGPGQGRLTPGMGQNRQPVLETARHERHHRYRIALVFSADGRMLDRAVFARDAAYLLLHDRIVRRSLDPGANSQTGEKKVPGSLPARCV